MRMGQLANRDPQSQEEEAGDGERRCCCSGRDAVATSRAVRIKPLQAGPNVPVVGSYSSADASVPAWFDPPVISTRPSASSVAVLT